MGKTNIRSEQIKDGQVKRLDLNAADAGDAVIRKIIAGTNITISETGPDTGTGDVTVNGPAGGGVTSMDYSFPTATNPYIEVASASYQLGARIIFPGTTKMGTPASIKVISWLSVSGTFHARIFDFSNSLQICEGTGFTNTAVEIKDLGTLSNLPAAEAIWELQFKRDGNEKVRTSGLNILF